MNNMFGKVLNIEENTIIFENGSHQANLQCLNYHVAIIDKDVNYIGEIVSINEEIIAVLLVGTIKNNHFNAGVIKKPSNLNQIRFLYKSELELLIGHQDDDINEIDIGNSNIYENFTVNAKSNEFLSNHFAIIGNTGSGKSCGTARIIQNLLKPKNGKIPEDAHIVLFDAYGEYNQAFSKISDVIGLNVKKYTTKVESPDDSLIKIPAALLDIDDLALLLNVSETSQLHILEKAKKLVYVFKSNDEKVSSYKNDIIAKCIMDILASGKSGTQIRDQIIAVLANYYTEELSLESIISQPGYNRTLKQCLNIDDQGKISSLSLVIDFLQQFIHLNVDDLTPEFNFSYNLDDFYYALEFALISEGTINSSASYEKNNILKNRLLNIINSSAKEFFEAGENININDFVETFFKKNNEACQLVNINISHVDDRLAKTITKIYAKIFFDYATAQKSRGSYPIHIILEEAHRYIQNDNDVFVIGYNIFDRICKEGRKYGVILGLITQRPSELSSTVLSQCSNFVIFRLFHPDDLKIVKSISINVNNEYLERIKSLSPGSALVFGNAFSLSTIVKFVMPDPTPNSASINITNIWYK